MKITCGTQSVKLQPGINVGSCLQACGVDITGVVGALCGSTVMELTDPVRTDCELKPLTVSDSVGRRIYERSLRFVMLLALRRLFPGQQVRVEFSYGDGVIVRMPQHPITAEDLARIEAEMHAIVDAAMPFECKTVSVEEAIEYFRADGQMDKVELLQLRPYDFFHLYGCGGMWDYFYGTMVPDTSKVSVFGLTQIDDRFVLSMPSAKDASQAAVCADMPKHLAVFSESADWSKILGIINAADLTRMSRNGEMRNFIRVNEALHSKSIASIADEIHAKQRRVILIAGPSSSGKTTFAHRLDIQLRVLGYHPLLISLDDYYRDRKDIAPGPDGTIDLESIDTLDLPLLNRQVNELLAGQEVEVPRFNFKTGSREEKGVRMRLPEGEPVLIEGIHGLNPSLSADMPQDEVFRVFVSALTCLNLDDHNRIRTTDVRLLRRIVRDRTKRGTSPEETIAMWPSVRAGEEVWIFPYQENADRVFNTTLHYELAFLKTAVGSVLRELETESPSVVLADNLRKILHYIPEIPAEIQQEIPPTSILREFIGGLSFDED